MMFKRLKKLYQRSKKTPPQPQQPVWGPSPLPHIAYLKIRQSGMTGSQMMWLNAAQQALFAHWEQSLPQHIHLITVHVTIALPLIKEPP